MFACDPLRLLGRFVQGTRGAADFRSSQRATGTWTFETKEGQHWTSNRKVKSQADEIAGTGTEFNVEQRVSRGIVIW